MFSKISISVFILSFILILSCNEEKPTEPKNYAPNIQSVTASPSSIKVNETTSLSCIATDADGDDLSYSWAASEGNFPQGAVGPSVTWKSPSVLGNYEIIVIVSDGKEIADSTINIYTEELSTRISGKLFDRETKEPIRGVKIILDSLVYFTDKSGNYEFFNLSKGKYDITAEMEHYFLYEGQVILSSGEIVFDISMDYMFTDLVGVVKDSYTGEILENVRVSINDKEYLTDQNGYYEFLGLDKGIYTIKADDESYKYPIFSEHISLANKKHNNSIFLLNICEDDTTLTHFGKNYNTIQIDNQCWFKENLNAGVMITGNSTSIYQTDNGLIEKFCYDNDSLNCEEYGALYQWSEAMQYQKNEGAQGICPTNWHIPTYAELIALRDAVGKRSNVLKAIDQGIASGAGTNKSGFSALFAGHRTHDPSYFNRLGFRYYLWSSTEHDNNAPYFMYLLHDDDYVRFDAKFIYNGYSIRCLKD